MTGISIAIENCAKTFAQDSIALHNVDLRIAGGETIVLLGPSGCGKTTLLRIIAGLETPDAGGRVRFGDQDVTHQPIERRNVGMVFQSYALFPNMTVEQNVAYGLRVRRTPAAERDKRVAEMLAMMHIGELRDRQIDQLSGGQRQRVALARAIAVRPTVLLLDEPLTALDALLRDRLRVEIDALLRSLGITAIYVTHDQGEAMALGDRIAVMSKGRIAQIGSPRDIYFKPENPFVADFIGTVNRLAGVAAGGRLSTPAGDLPWQGPAAGQTEVMFRPESVQLVPVDQGHLQGRVVNALFLGDRTRAIVEVAGGAKITVDTQERGILRPGDQIGLRLKEGEVFTLPSSQSAAAS